MVWVDEQRDYCTGSLSLRLNMGNQLDQQPDHRHGVAMLGICNSVASYHK
jgi:hypothetical protein